VGLITRNHSEGGGEKTKEKNSPNMEIIKGVPGKNSARSLNRSEGQRVKKKGSIKKISSTAN